MGKLCRGWAYEARSPEQENNVKNAKTRFFPLFVVLLVSAAIPLVEGSFPAILKGYPNLDAGPSIEIGTLNQRLVMGA